MSYGIINLVASVSCTIYISICVRPVKHIVLYLCYSTILEFVNMSVTLTGAHIIATGKLHAQAKFARFMFIRYCTKNKRTDILYGYVSNLHHYKSNNQSNMTKQTPEMWLKYISSRINLIWSKL